MNHIIKKQIINLEMAPKLDAFRLQQLVSAHYWKEIIPLLEKIFDEISGADEIITVDHLEIDLGFVSEKSIEQNAWTMDLQPILKKKFEESLFTSTAINRAAREPVSLNAGKQWIYYIRNGYLPWNVFSADDHWHGRVLEGLATDFSSVQLLRNLIYASPDARKRIIEQHTTSFLVSLLEILTARKQSDLPELFHELFVLFEQLTTKGQNKGMTEAAFKKDLWLNGLIFASDNKGPKQLATRMLSIFLREHRLADSLSPEWLSRLPLVQSLITDLDIPERKEKRALKKDPEDKRDEADAQDIFLCHAGMVLLHPFLSSLFHRLSLMQENHFIDRPSRLKGIYLLHYIVTGKVEAKEYELLMAKLLCAWPLREPVDSEAGLTESELEEADQLLQAVIQQWEILKDTSATGLRESFLQRNGKLSFKHGNIYLHVETSGIDLLLDHLPWNLGTIKLPWMNELLRVEWR